MLSAHKRMAGTARNPAIANLIRANKTQQEQLIASLNQELERPDEMERELAAFALGYLIPTRNQLDNPIFWQKYGVVIPAGATVDQLKIAALDHILSRAADHILRKAKRYEPEALCLLAKHSIGFVKELNRLARNVRGRDALRPLAEGVEAWPVLKSTHVQYNQNEGDFLDSLKVGQGMPRKMSGARWQPDSLADQIWCEIHHARFRPVWPGFRNEEQEHLTRNANRLRDFNSVGAPKQWAKLAIKLCVKRMKDNSDFRKEVGQLIPPSKRGQGEKSWLERYFTEKFSNMQPVQS